MSVIVRISCIILIFFLNGCAHQKPALEMAACKQSCQQRLSVCSKTCGNSCLQCEAFASRMTQNSYNKYVNEQCVSGGYLTRQLQSYRDPLQCRKITCECVADYQVCVQSCTGVIRKRLQVPLTCC